ncbi:MAG TPA: XdhC family protein [Tepidisphaeraceae bacterium]|nr:XdhC family protein [Tepidisphaeraceae bacterium]
MRSELPQLIALARRLLESDEVGTLSTLISANGSSYRSIGSLMVGGPPGVFAGGVSGGCLEEYILRHARELTRDRSATVLSFDTGSGDVDEAKPVLGCGTSIDVLVEKLMPDHLEYLQQLASAYDSDVASIVTCTINGDENSPTITRRCGAPSLDEATSNLARLAMSDRRSYSEQTNAKLRSLVHYVPPITRLVILGTGDDVKPVSDLARSLGWHVTTADVRARHARPDRFPSADTVISAPSWDELIDQIQFTDNTAILLMTHSLPDDVEILPLLVNKQSAYIGILGPAHRRDGLVQFAMDAGSINDEFASRLHGPIGLDLGDRSAPGIAVSVIAEIVAHLNGRDGSPMSSRSISQNDHQLSHHLSATDA